MSEVKSRDSKFWLGFFIGGLLGAVTLFFLGTKEGKKTKDSLEKKGKDLIDELADKVEELEGKGKNLVKEGEIIKAKIIEQTEEVKEDLGASTAEKLNTALENIEKLQEQGRETTATLRKRLFKNIPKKK